MVLQVINKEKVKIIIEEDSVTTIERISAQEIINRYKELLTKEQLQILKNHRNGLL